MMHIFKNRSRWVQLLRQRVRGQLNRLGPSPQLGRSPRNRLADCPDRPERHVERVDYENGYGDPQNFPEAAVLRSQT